jgi:RNA polymerase sigma factor (sigma-70 family)
MSDAEALPGELYAGGETAKSDDGKHKEQIEAERRCLSEIIAGGDAWPEFFRLFQDFFNAVARQRQVKSDAELEDLWSAFIAELIDNDYQMLRRHLEEYPGHSFKSILWWRISQLTERHQRQQRGQAFLDDGFFDSVAAGPDCAELGNPAAVYENRRLMRDAIIHASQHARDRRRIAKVLSLRFGSGATNKEIAKQFRISENLVADIIRRYSPRMREYLER